MATPEPCTSHTARKRHLSTDLTAHSVGGRRGETLCVVGGVGTGAYDEEAINAYRRQWVRSAPWLTIGALPECKACLKAAAKLAEAKEG